MSESGFVAGGAGGFDSCQLARYHPALFAALVEEYKRLIQLAIEETVFHRSRQVFARLREVAKLAGEKDALPQDLVAVHLSALAALAETLPRTMAKACVQHARVLLVKMLGELALYYREQAFLARKASSEL